VCNELTFETENVVGCLYPDVLRDWAPDRRSSDRQCSVTELGSCPYLQWRLLGFKNKAQAFL